MNFQAAVGAVIIASALVTDPTSVGAPIKNNQPQTNSGPELMLMSYGGYMKRFGHAPPAGAPKAIPAGAKVVDSAAALKTQSTAADVYTLMFQHRDLNGRDLVTRQGMNTTTGFGYEHYAFEHNLTTERPIKTAYENNYPDVEDGTCLEYRAHLFDSATGEIFATVRVVNVQSVTSRDGVYTTPDGRSLGTITAFCDGLDVCPNEVN